MSPRLHPDTPIDYVHKPRFVGPISGGHNKSNTMDLKNFIPVRNISLSFHNIFGSECDDRYQIPGMTRFPVVGRFHPALTRMIYMGWSHGTLVGNPMMGGK